MRRTHVVHIGVAAFSCVLPVLAAHAQTTSPEPKPITIVGCVVEREGDSETATANDYFILTPAISVPAGSTIAINAAGRRTSTGERRATTSAGDPTANALYRITGLDREQLKSHVGHRVELQGQLTADLPTSSGSDTKVNTTVGADGRATTQVESPNDIAGALHATTLKMVSTTCQ
jgi:hypothetical protein